MTPIVIILLGGALGELLQKPLASPCKNHLQVPASQFYAILVLLQEEVCQCHKVYKYISFVSLRTWLSDSKILHWILPAYIILSNEKCFFSCSVREPYITPSPNLIISRKWIANTDLCTVKPSLMLSCSFSWESTLWLPWNDLLFLYI